MARKHMLAALAAAAALAVAAPSGAQAATCGSQPSPARTADVIFDGIVLSGPRLGLTGDLLSPAHLQVVRYLRGHGPRIVRVATSFRQGEPGSALVAGSFTPEPGEVLRIYGRTPSGAGSSTARGVLEPTACGSFAIRKPDAYLHSFRGVTTRAQSTQGGAPWTAQPLHGPSGLLCVRFQPANRPAGVDREAECASRPGRRRLLVGIAATSQGATTSTAVVVAARSLRRVSIESPDGPQEVTALGSSLPMAVAVFRGLVDPTQFEVHATFAGGKRADVKLASRRADAPDPGGQGGWAVFGQAAYPHVPRGICASFWQPLPRFRDLAAAPLPDEACGRLGRTGYWFAVTSVYGTPPAGGGGPSQHTVVTGAVGLRVAGVTVSAGGTPYPVALARSGRAFLAVLPSGLAPRDVSVAFRLTDGTTRLYTGRPAFGVLHIRREAL